MYGSFGTLPVTATRSDWRWHLLPAPFGAEFDATLSITEQKRSRDIADVYAVECHHTDSLPGRSFLLCKVDHTGDLHTKRGQQSKARCGEVYETWVLDDGGWKCTCPGGCGGKHECLHTLALREYIAHEEGVLPMSTVPEQPQCEVRPIAGYDGYFVGRDGTVWSTRRSKTTPTVYYPIKVHQPDDWSRYCRVYLRKNRSAGQTHPKYVHRLVLEAFVGPCPDGMVARHRDDRDTTNNHVNNLCWGTQQQNIDDKKRHGTNLAGTQISQAKLTPEVVRQIRLRYSQGALQRELAEEFGVEQTSISRVIRRETWKDVDDDSSLPADQPASGPVGSENMPVEYPDPLDRYANTGEDSNDYREMVA